MVVQTVKKLPARQQIWVLPLVWEDLLQNGMAIHSSIFAWRIPWTEEPGGLQSMGHKEVDMTKRLTHTHTHTHTRFFSYLFGWNLLHKSMWNLSRSLREYLIKMRCFLQKKSGIPYPPTPPPYRSWSFSVGLEIPSLSLLSCCSSQPHSIAAYMYLAN